MTPFVLPKDILQSIFLQIDDPVTWCTLGMVSKIAYKLSKSLLIIKPKPDSDPLRSIYYFPNGKEFGRYDQNIGTEYTDKRFEVWYYPPNEHYIICYKGWNASNILVNIVYYKSNPEARTSMKHGVERSWYDDGQLKEEIHRENGRVIKYKRWYNNGIQEYDLSYQPTVLGGVKN